MEEQIICARCHLPLEPAHTEFTYLGHAFSADIPRCPQCGMVYISEELVKTRITEVETQLEDK